VHRMPRTRTPSCSTLPGRVGRRTPPRTASSKGRGRHEGGPRQNPRGVPVRLVSIAASRRRAACGEVGAVN
jgi:hypothetical protein